ncbi:FG-GAP-like repeat-containing protein [Micromonospora sp. NPDC051141]|uniref:FG-GAP-like repeat-containing protein n=1 Tax=Micromonospora sp. NPDC051141 TaxID=3364284 RepID=UPI00379D3744
MPTPSPGTVANPSATVASVGTFGGVAGKASVGATGAAGYEIPLRVVPGRGGFEPRLSLRYSSLGGNGQVGVGFGLTGLSQIARCAKTIVDNQVSLGVQLNDSDVFCLDGQKLLSTGGAYGADGTTYKTVPDRHVLVKSLRAAGTPASEVGPTGFTVWRPDGTVEQYGGSGTRTQVVVASTAGLVNTAWAVRQASDRSGNTMVFDYEVSKPASASGSEVERRITSISYGNGATLDRKVEFAYEARPDVWSGFALGAPRERTQRLKTVTMSADPGTGMKRARSYSLGYANDGVTKASKLVTVRECGTVASECERPTTFDWTRGKVGFGPGVAQASTAGVPLTPDAGRQVVAGDFNGDGRTDVAWAGQFAWNYLMAQPGPNTYQNLTDGPAGSASLGGEAWPMDYDGDGRTDLLPRKNQPDSTWSPLVSRADGSVVKVSTPFTGGFNQTGGDEAALPGDFDGDGYQDVLMYKPTSGSGAWTWRQRTGTVDAAVDGANPSDNQAYGPAKTVALGNLPPSSISVVDVDGDGRDEVLYQLGAVLFTLDLVKNTGWSVDLPGYVRLLDRKWLDLNGDGLVDLITNGNSATKGSRLYYWLNTGRTMTGPYDTGLATGGAELPLTEVVDFEGDGFRDLLVPRPSGNSYVGLDVIRVGWSGKQLTFSRSQTPVDFAAKTADEMRSQGPRIVDANGDGQADVLVLNRPASGPAKFVLFSRLVDNDTGIAEPDLLRSIYEGEQKPYPIDSPGSSLPPTVVFAYAPLSEGGLYSHDGCVRKTGVACVRGNGRHVVKEVRSDAGLDGQAQMIATYGYADGRVDMYGRGDLGFAERRTVSYPKNDPARIVTERSFTWNEDRKTGPLDRERWVIHKLPGNRMMLDRTITSWESKGSAPNFFSYLAKSEQLRYEFPTNNSVYTIPVVSIGGTVTVAPVASTTTTTPEIDFFGFPLKTVVHSMTQAGVRETRTTTLSTPLHNVDEWLIRRAQEVVTSEEVLDPKTSAFKPAQTRTRTYTYEGDTDRVDSIRSFASNAARGRELRTAFDYDASGNVTRRTSTDLASGEVRETTYAYDDFGLPHAVMNGKLHTSRTHYDPLLGALKVAVDANGLRTDYTYDSLGRLVKTKLPTGVERTVNYAFENGKYPEQLLRVEIADGTGAVSQTVFDRLGRSTVERFKGFDGTMRERTLDYDTRGDLTALSTYHPASAPVADIKAITFGYDDLGRVVERREPDTDKPQTWVYDGLSTHHTDTRGGVKISTVDDRGRLVGQTDGKGTADAAVRTYGYGPFDTLVETQIAGTDSSKATFTYDPQGALTSRADGERGTTTYTYNAFGEVTSWEDAEARKAVLAYDVLGRETTRTVTKGGATTSVTTHVWDSVAGRTRQGMLMQVAQDERAGTARGTVTTDYSYDGFGRLDTVSQAMPTSTAPTAPVETLTADYDHDAFGRVSKMRYPKLAGQSAATEVTYNYGPASSTNGRLTSVQTGPTPLWTATATDSQDRLVTEETGDGVTTNQTLDWDGQVLDLRTATSDDDVNPDETLFAESYGYDDHRNLTSRSQGEIREEFTYDPLNRLASAKTSHVRTGQVYQTDDWDYNNLGNLVKSELRGTYTYGDTNRPTQVTKVTDGLFGTRDYGYDKVGNQTVRPDGAITYTDRDLASQITTPAGATLLQYDGNGQRVRKASSQETVTYLPGLYERHQGPTGTDHRFRVSVGGRDVATLGYFQAAGATSVVKQATLYTHTDRLGSTRLVTKNADLSNATRRAVPVETRSYDALGKRRNPDLTRGDDQYTTGITAPAVEQGYTGHGEDDELGLVNMVGRIYDPTLGRFTTPDPFTHSANATQAFNRYAYVSGNPLAYTDPSGYTECGAGSHCTNVPECVPNDDGGCGGTSTDNPCANPLMCADEVTVYGDPHDPDDDIVNPDGGAPRPGDGDEGDNNGVGGCSGCGDGQQNSGGEPFYGGELPVLHGSLTDDTNPNDAPVCEAVCRDEAQEKEASQSQTSVDTSATPNGNPAGTDICNGPCSAMMEGDRELTSDEWDLVGVPPVNDNGPPVPRWDTELLDTLPPPPGPRTVEGMVDWLMTPQLIERGSSPIGGANWWYAGAAVSAAAGAGAVAGSMLAEGGWVVLLLLL